MWSARGWQNYPCQSSSASVYATCGNSNAQCSTNVLCTKFFRAAHCSWGTAGRIQCSAVCFDQVERSAGSKCYVGSTYTYGQIQSIAYLAMCRPMAKPGKQQLPARCMESKLCHFLVYRQLNAHECRCCTRTKTVAFGEQSKSVLCWTWAQYVVHASTLQCAHLFAGQQ